MKIAVLTTDTAPHRFFVNEIARNTNYMIGVFLEAEPADPHGFKLPVTVQQGLAEFNTWSGLKGSNVDWARASTFCTIKSLNYAFAITELKRFKPDLILVNGTLKLGAEIIAIAPDRIVNFHSGDPRHYRGLHCDMWTIWHKDWNNLGVCAHRLVEKLDAGAVLDAEMIVPPADLAGLGVAKAEAAAKLARRVVERFERNRVFEEDYTPGRYYGLMPTVLQEQVDGILKRRASG